MTKTLSSWYIPFIGDGYRLLEIGEQRQPGDEFILEERFSLILYWPWDARFDSLIQGKMCYPTRRKTRSEQP